jgi:hypothetical protein
MRYIRRGGTARRKQPPDRVQPRRDEILAAATGGD